MKKVLGISSMIATAYYACTLIVFMHREMEGSAFSRLLRVFIVAWYGVLTCLYLLREVVQENEPAPEGDEPETATPAS